MTSYVHQISEREAEKIRRFLIVLAAGTVLFVVVIILAILTADKWLTLISHESEHQFIEPYIEWTDENLLSTTDPVLQQYIETLAFEIAEEFDLDDSLQLEVRVIKGGPVNAFAMLGGYLFVFEDLISSLDNENSLAMVLAHEIAHARNRDPLLGAGRGILLQLSISTLSGGGIDPNTINLGSDLMLNTYSREQERKADRLALAALQRRYQHVGGATGLFDLLRDTNGSADTVEILSTHPDLNQRILSIEQMARDNNWPGGETTPFPAEVVAVLANER
jgi:predicted Zn-dependent protease